MAILPNVPGISVRVFVNNEPAKELTPPMGSSLNSEVRTVNLPRVHRYIESQSGHSYTVILNLTPEYRFPAGCETLISNLVIDGKVFSKGCIRKSDTQQPGGLSSKCAYRLSDNLTDEKMVLAFSDLTTGEL